MKALVLGASGHVGNAVVRELLGRGWQVTAAWCHGESPVNLAGLDVERSRADDTETSHRGGDAWAARVAGHDLVVDAAAPYPLHADLLHAAGLAGRPGAAAARTDHLLAAVRSTGARFAYVSSFATLSDKRPGTSWMRRLHPYFALKQDLDRRVLEAARDGLPAVVVHPTLCLGPWDRKPAALSFVAQLIQGKMPLTFRQLINVVDVRDVARALLAAVDQELYGEPLPLAGHNVEAGELFAWVCEEADVPLPRPAVSPRLSLLPALTLEALAVAGGRRYAPFLGVLLLAELGWHSGSALRRLRVVPRALSATVQDTVAWYRSARA